MNQEGMAALAGVVIIGQWVLGHRTRCPDAGGTTLPARLGKVPSGTWVTLWFQSSTWEPKSNLRFAWVLADAKQSLAGNGVPPASGHSLL